MRNRWSYVVLYSALYGLASSANAAEEPLSYAADNACYCNVSNAGSIKNRIVSTPIGGQSVAQVCERIGEGPKLQKIAGRYNFPVFDDAQCGHGPGYSGFVGLVDDAGTDVKVGPKWNLAAAYATGSVARTTGSAVRSKPTSKKPQTISDVVVKNSTTNANKPSVATNNEAANELTAKQESSGDKPTQPATRLKPRYVKVPSMSRVGGATTVNTDKPIVADSAGAKALESSANVVNRKLPAVTIAPTVAKAETPAKTVITEPTVKNIEELPLAQTFPMDSTVGDAAVESREVAEVTEQSPGSVLESTEPSKLPKMAEKTMSVEITPMSESTVQQADVSDLDNTEQAVATVTPELTEIESSEANNVASNALRSPAATSATSRTFEYLSVMPITYHYGGSGLMFSASSRQSENLRLLIRASLAQTYQEGVAGASYVYSPANSNRLTFALTGGLEHGRFTLREEEIETTVADTGAFIQAHSEFAVTKRFALHAGVGVSTFFDGDPHAFGGAMFRLSNQFELTSEVEVGDNDSVGFGVRYYY